MKSAWLIVYSIVLTLLISCTKAGTNTTDDPNQVDQSDDIFPVLTVSKPVPNQVFSSGDSVIVEGKATDNKVMYKGKVQLKNDATGLIVAEQYYETHILSTLNFRIAYKAVVTTSTDFTVITEFQDHGLNTVNNTFKVKVNP